MQEFSTVGIFAPSGTVVKSAIRRADRLVSRGGTIRLFDVLPEFTVLERAVIPERLQALYTREREYELREAARDVEVTHRLLVEVLTGSAVVSVVQTVLKRRLDLLLKPTAVSTEDEPVGALDMKLIRKCPCPVWLVRRGAAHPALTVLAAINPFDADTGGDGLNQSILRYAIGIATADAANVHVVAAWSLYGEQLLRRGLGPEEVDHYVDELRSRVEDAFRSELKPHTAIEDANKHVICGDAADVIVGLADQLAADVVVMGTVGRGGLSGVLIGNTAETVLRRVRCEVLAVKPTGFVSPIAANVLPGASVQ